MNQARVKSLARLFFFLTGVPRQEVLEKVGQDFGLRELEDRKSKYSMVINCPNEEVQKQALELEGIGLSYHDGRTVGKLSVHRDQVDLYNLTLDHEVGRCVFVGIV